MAMQHTSGPSLDHRCQDEPCCYFGQRSSRDCGCHKTREQMADEIIAELVEVLEAIRQLETRDVHVSYDNGSGGGNYVYADYISAEDAFAIIDAALAKARAE
jgi:hypothetical protein